MTDLKTWDVAAGGNNDASPDGFPENMDRTGVNDSAREMMASIRRWYNDPTWVDPFEDYVVSRNAAQVVRIAGIDATGLLVDDRRIRLSGGGVVYGFVDSTAYAASDTLATVTLDGGATVPVGTDTIEMAAVAAGRSVIRNVMDSGDAPTPTSKLISISGLVDAATAQLGTAALADTGTNPTEVPTNDDLGTVAVLDAGAGAAEIPNVAEVEALIVAARPFAVIVPIATEDSNNVSNALWAPSDWTGVPITGADGTKTYRITCIAFIEDGVGVLELQIRVGPTGDETDEMFNMNNAVGDNATGVNTFGQEATADEDVTYLAAIVQPSAGDKVTISIKNDTDGTGTIRKILTAGTDGAPQKSLLAIEEIQV